MKRDILRRFAYIETCLYWGEGLTAVQLGKTFSIARQNAQASIETYRKKHPDSMTYNRSTKRHEAGDNFRPQYISREPRHYLNYLRGNALANHYWEDEEWGHLPVEDVDSLFRPYLNAQVIGSTIRAIQNQEVLRIYYHAKAGGFENLTIAPNHLVYASKRYHFRAYCYELNRFIDLVLSRIIETDVIQEDWVSSDEDNEWNTHAELSFIPNPELPESVRNTLLLDFRLENGVFTISVRKALENYVMREMERLDWKHHIPLWCKTSTLHSSQLHITYIL
uniref:Transcriptional regulator n=1 Tax=uncultured Thiotrichaceae bacterium TaxID=298394 RepID=A0A6S6U484_9GAMM|nr:MAG: Transcriptional regulator [uncultured Thiotrichaceae bacterium]